jgi:hypothetical protein
MQQKVADIHTTILAHSESIGGERRALIGARSLATPATFTAYKPKSTRPDATQIEHTGNEYEYVLSLWRIIDGIRYSDSTANEYLNLMEDKLDRLVDLIEYCRMSRFKSHKTLTWISVLLSELERLSTIKVTPEISKIEFDVSAESELTDDVGGLELDLSCMVATENVKTLMELKHVIIYFLIQLRVSHFFFFISLYFILKYYLFYLLFIFYFKTL